MLELKLKVPPSASNQVPHNTKPARVVSPPGFRQVSARPATRATRAAGSSHPMSLPNEPVSSRSHAAGGGFGILMPMDRVSSWLGDASSRRPTPLLTKTCWKSELFWLPSTYGRVEAGVSVTTVIQPNDTTAAAMPIAPMRTSLRRQLPAAATRYTSASAGRTIHASTIFAWKARPTQNPTRRVLDHRLAVTAATAESAASKRSRTMRLSEMLPRLRAPLPARAQG